MRRASLLFCFAILVTGCRVWTVFDVGVVNDPYFSPGDVERLPGGGIVVTSCTSDGSWGGRGIILARSGQPVQNFFLCDGPNLNVSAAPDGLIYFSHSPDGEAANRIDRLDPDTGQIETVFSIQPGHLPIYGVTVAPDGRILFGTRDPVPDAQGKYHDLIHEVTGSTTSTAFAGTSDLGRSDFAVDAAGTLYAAGWPPLGEPARQQVIAVTANGARTVIAGTGVAGFSGDGGQATAARLNYPSGVDIAANGHVFVADTLNNRVRSIRPDGTIVTVAGGGTSTTEGVFALASALDRPIAVAADTGPGFWTIDGGPIGPRVIHVGLSA